MHLSATVPAEKTLLNDSSNNELLVINLATVRAEGILIPVLHKCVAVGGNFSRPFKLTMKFTDKEYLNKILTIIDACQTDALIDFSFNLPADFYKLTNPNNTKGLSLKKYVDADFKLKLTQQNKHELITVLADNFDEGEICHYAFYHDGLKIGEGFDHCEINFLNPKYFVFTQAHFDNLVDDDIKFKELE